MYGIILLTVKNLVVTKFSEDKWNKICTQAGVANDFQPGVNYEEDVLYKMVNAASSVLGLSAPEVIEAVGYWFVIYIRTKEYGKMFSVVGNSLPETLKNINSLHGHMKVAHFHGMMMPTFRAIALSDSSMRLQYTPGLPSRVGLGPLVIGLVKAVAEVLHGISDLSINQTKWRGKGSSHDEFYIAWTTNAIEDGSEDSSASSDRTAVGLDGAATMRLFPFHIAFNKKMEIVQSGASITRLIGLEKGQPLSNYFIYLHPKEAKLDSFSHARLAFSNGDQIVLEHNSVAVHNFRLKGEFVYVRGKHLMFFVGTPILISLEEASHFKLSLNDFALHDPLKDLMFHANARSADEGAPIPLTTALLSQDSPLVSPRPISPPPAVVEGRGRKPAKEKQEQKKPNVLSGLFNSKIKPAKSAPDVPSVSVAFQRDKERDKDSLKSSGGGSYVGEAGGSLHKSRSTTGEGIYPSNSWLLSPSNSLTSLPAAVISAGGGGGGCPFSSMGANTPLDVEMLSMANNRISLRFHELLMDDCAAQFPVVMFLLEQTMKDPSIDQEDLFMSVLKFYSSKGRQMALLKAAFDQEISTTSDTILFRQESVATRLWNNLCKLEARPYFRGLIQRSFRVLESFDAHDEDESVKVSSEVTPKLLSAASQILEIVRNSALECPPALRNAMQYVFGKIERTIPGMPFVGIGSLFFLRALFPALLSPEKFLMAMPNPRKKVTVILVKMIQNAVTRVEFDGTKESKMTPLNSFVSGETTKRAIAEFLETVIDPSFNFTLPSSVTQALNSQETASGSPTGGDAIRNSLKKSKSRDAISSMAAVQPLPATAAAAIPTGTAGSAVGAWDSVSQVHRAMVSIRDAIVGFSGPLLEAAPSNPAVRHFVNYFLGSALSLIC